MKSLWPKKLHFFKLESFVDETTFSIFTHLAKLMILLPLGMLL